MDLTLDGAEKFPREPRAGGLKRPLLSVGFISRRRCSKSLSHRRPPEHHEIRQGQVTRKLVGEVALGSGPFFSVDTAPAYRQPLVVQERPHLQSRREFGLRQRRVTAERVPQFHANK